MKRFVSVLLTTFSLLCLLWATEPRALGLTGYVDPGSGLLALQCLTSVFATVGFFMRKRITALFGKKSEKGLGESGLGMPRVNAKGESLGDA